MASKFTIVLLFSCICVITAQNYPTKFDKDNIEIILSNDRVLTNYINCLLEKGPCTKAGLELKRFLPDALQGDCSKCTTSQKLNSKKVITFLRTRRPADWRSLMDKYDPQGIFKQRIDFRSA